MKVNEYPQIAVVTGKTPKEFQENFNAKMKELAEFNPSFKFMEKNDLLAVISYIYKERIMDCVADEFHAEGIIYLCKNCPYMQDPRDKRVMTCGCKYADLGRTHKLHEACEVFYRDLKAGKITPLENYER